ncbi:MAG: hypothetical protein M1404_06275 [Acidobacteria bacterium]|nr:hypothetical protein [Acidobacteriota bacterium]
MRCDVVRRMVEEDIEMAAGVQAHVASCPACAEYIRRWELLRAGFAVLKEEEPPHASLGFAERLVRRLAYARAVSQTGQQFVVQAGKRVVYATLLVALMLILGLVLPSSGPLRTPRAAEPILSQPQIATMSPEQIIGISDSSYSRSVPASRNQQRGQESR